jgi:hypothetical protein
LGKRRAKQGLLAFGSRNTPGNLPQKSADRESGALLSVQGSRISSAEKARVTT